MGGHHADSEALLTDGHRGVLDAIDEYPGFVEATRRLPDVHRSRNAQSDYGCRRVNLKAELVQAFCHILNTVVELSSEPWLPLDNIEPGHDSGDNDWRQRGGEHI